MSANSSLLLECKGIDKNYNGPMVLSNVDFSLKRGEIHATLHGSLMGILEFANDNSAPDARRVITSVASGSPG